MKFKSLVGYLFVALFSVTILTGCGDDTTTSTQEGSNKAPIVNAGKDKTVQINETVTITGTASDSDGTIVSYEWKKGNSVLATTLSFSYRPTVVGRDLLTLTVVDNDGDSSSDTMTVIVKPKVTTTSKKVKKTGQTKSYIKFDDGYYKKGVTPSYTRDDVKEVVTDNLTGLMWQDNKEAKTVRKPWVTQENYDVKNFNDTIGDTATTYCVELVMGGFEDWRLPTVKELESIVNYRQVKPSIDTIYFKNVSSNYYWSSTTTYMRYRAWYVSFGSGDVDGNSKNDNYYIRCVRNVE